MASVRETFKTIIERLLKEANTPSPRGLDKDFPFPRLIATGDGGSIEVSKEVDDLITAIAADLRREGASRSAVHTDEEWRAAVRRAFGPAIAALDVTQNADQQTDKVLASVRDSLQKMEAGVTPYEYSFGLTLFSGNEIDAFQIGPVRFEPRTEWLDRKSADGAVTSITRRRVLQTWQGNRLRKRKSSTDSERERDIVSAIGNCSWVVSVSTTGLANDAGKQRALTAARMATAAVSLLWAKPSQVLDGVNLLVDRSIRREKVLTFSPGRIILAGSRLIGRPSAPFISQDDWKQSLADYDRALEAAAELISFYLEPTGNVARPKLMNTLTQALLWFHEGCRETVTLMAIVKLTASLDALAKGGKSGGIKKMITARLGAKPSDKLWADGTSMEQGVNEIYSDARSRTMHGTNDKLGHDWTSTRARAEGIARLCLIVCMEWASRNPTLDDPALLQK
jgi:hypothetical protein